MKEVAFRSINLAIKHPTMSCLSDLCQPHKRAAVLRCQRINVNSSSPSLKSLSSCLGLKAGGANNHSLLPGGQAAQ